MRHYEPFTEYRFSQRRNSGALFAMLAIGLGAGALAALLFAPRTGKQMRKSLRRKFEDTRDSMGEWKDSANEFIERGSEWASTAKERVAPFARKMSR